MTEKNVIKYAIAENVASKMLKEGLISQDEYEHIDVLNKKKFGLDAININDSSAVAKAVANINVWTSIQTSDKHKKPQQETIAIFKNESQVSVRELAFELGRHPTKFHDWIKKHNYQVEKVKSMDRKNRGQLVSVVSDENADEIRKQLSNKSESKTKSRFGGYFYLIQLEPEKDPNLIKLGYSNNPVNILRDLQYSAPKAKLLETWECKKLWEITLIDIITTEQERLNANKTDTKCFMVKDLNETIKKVDAFFIILI